MIEIIAKNGIVFISSIFIVIPHIATRIVGIASVD